MSEKRLAEVFLQSWHPVTELEQLTKETVLQALTTGTSYCQSKSDGRGEITHEGKTRRARIQALLDGLGIHGKEFAEQLTGLWKDLRQIYVAEQNPVEYWRFVKGPTHQETVQRAYFVSFLVTYGYAKLQTRRGDDDAHTK